VNDKIVADKIREITHRLSGIVGEEILAPLCVKCPACEYMIGMVDTELMWLYGQVGRVLVKLCFRCNAELVLRSTSYNTYEITQWSASYNMWSTQKLAGEMWKMNKAFEDMAKAIGNVPIIVDWKETLEKK